MTNIIQIPTDLNIENMESCGSDPISINDLNRFVSIFNETIIPMMIGLNFTEKKAMSIFGALAYGYFKMENMSDEELLSIFRLSIEE